MRLRRIIAASVCIGAVLQAQAASALTLPVCLERKQAETLVAFALPVLIDGVGTKCRASLPANAPLAGSSPGARYRADANAAWPAAQATLDRVASNLIPDFMTEEVKRTVIEQAVAAALVEKVAVQDCVTIDQALTALAPLPGRNIAQAVVIAYDLFSRSREDLPFRLCASGASK
jgi:hypothetical protein